MSPAASPFFSSSEVGPIGILVGSWETVEQRFGGKGLGEEIKGERVALDINLDINGGCLLRVTVWRVTVWTV